MLSQKRRQYFVYWRAFWQRRCRAAAAGAVLKPSGGNSAVLPLQQIGNILCYNKEKEGFS